MDKIIGSAYQKIIELCSPFVISIDGLCGAGKTTIANAIQKWHQEQGICADIIHMDHFFLQKHQRSMQRLAEPGGNIDYERFTQDIVSKLKNTAPLYYTPFNCTTMTMDEPIQIQASQVVIVEGSYSLHPVFKKYYDISIFVTTPKEEQLSRLKKRGSDVFEMFIWRWIPMENKYFSHYKIEESCDLIINN